MTASAAWLTNRGRAKRGEFLTLGQFTETKLLVPRLLSGRQDGAIQELTKRMEATGRISNAPSFVEAALKRELDLPTFAGDGVAVPHVRGGAVRELSVAVGLSATGICWGRAGRRTAHAVFLFAVPLAEAATYLALLSGLSSLIFDETAFASLKHAKQPEEMLRVFHAVRLVRQDVQSGVPCRA